MPQNPIRKSVATSSAVSKSPGKATAHGVCLLRLGVRGKPRHTGVCLLRLGVRGEPRHTACACYDWG